MSTAATRSPAPGRGQNNSRGRKRSAGRKGITDTTAPVLNKVVVSPPARDPGADPKRVGAAIHFGAALEELVARCRLLPDAPDAPRESSSLFPADLSHRRTPEDALWSTFDKLRELERVVVLEPLNAETGTTPNGAATPEDRGQTGAAYQRPRFHPGGRRAEYTSTNLSTSSLEEIGRDERAAFRESPSERIRKKIEELLAAREADENFGNLYQYLSGEGGLDGLIGEWDAHIIRHIAGTAPRTLAGYKVGKALSLTRWQIWAARYRIPAEDPSETWDGAFGARRVGEIQRQINSLSDVLDPEALTIVATSLGYWRHTLLSLPYLAGLPETGPPDQKQRTIEIPSGQEDELEVALERQLDNWLDLLTGRRPPGSFPVAGIVTTLTKNLVASPWAKRLESTVRFFTGFGVVAVVAAVLLAVAVVVVPLLGVGSGNIATEGLLGSLATGAGGIVAFLAARGRTMFDRGGGVDQLRGRVDSLEQLGVLLLGDSEAGRAPDGQATGPRQVTWQGLKDDVLSQLVGQIRLEELNIAASEPLVTYVLTLGDEESDDPQENAKRFLELAYGDRSNLNRLLPVFEELYKHFRTAPPG